MGRESERRRRSRSRSRSRERSRRSRSRERSRERPPPRVRKSAFDVGPTGEVAAPVALVPGLPGFPPVPGLPSAQLSAQATRHARRIYIGGLPAHTDEASLGALFNQAMQSIGGVALPGDSVQNVFINSEKKFAFVEFRSVEECSNAMALDGIVYEGVPIRIRRPNDYNPVSAAILGPANPSAALNLAALGLSAASTLDLDRICVGGLPTSLTEAQVRELLQAFGPLRSLELVQDAASSKGFALCSYADASVTDLACSGLHGMALGDTQLSMQRVTAAAELPPVVLQRLAEHAAIGALPPAAAGPPPTPVLVLENVVTEEELRNDEEFADISMDMREECGRFGHIEALHIPRPPAAGTGRVFVRFASADQALAAHAVLHGRKFGGQPVQASYMAVSAFEELLA